MPSIPNYREILRLTSEGRSQRQIESSVHSSHQTISEVQKTAREKHIQWPLDESVTNEMLRDILFPGRFIAAATHPEPDYLLIHTELAKPNTNLTLLWKEYCDRCTALEKTPYMYSQFCDKYRAWAKITKATMRIQHKPGDAMQVDWAGSTIPIYDPITGDETKAYLFVAVLPCSCYTYAEACEDMKLESWLYCHVHAYRYFGGVTRLLVPDNLKTGVTKNTRYETVLNRSYQELAEHYDTAIVPARVEHPRDKGTVEGTVRYVSTWILAALRNERFFSLTEVNEAVHKKLEELNRTPFRKRDGCRRDAYLEEEKAFMKPLPVSEYEPSAWTPNITVGYDYLVSDGRNRYSVPFDLIGEKVDLRMTGTMVEVFFHGNRIAVHPRAKSVQRDPIVNQEHMPAEHRKYLNYNAEDFQTWANGIGDSAAAVVKHFLTSGKEPEVGFKACVSLTKLAEKHGKVRLEKTCTDALKLTASPSIRTISTILKNGKDKFSDYKPDETTEKFGITRGADYFGKGGERK